MIDKVVIFLACFGVFLTNACFANTLPDVSSSLFKEEIIANNYQGSTDTSLAEVLAIKQTYFPDRDDTYYLEIDIKMATMLVYKVVKKAEDAPELELLSKYKVGTPKVKDYPKGFGIITSVEFNPSWMPTSVSVEEFRKHGTDLSKFRTSNGNIVVPAGSPMNFMGAVKMRISFVTPQKTAKTRRNVYRIHGVLPRYKNLLGTRCSGGCIRMDNKEIKDLANMTQGAAVVIQYKS